MFAAPDHKNMNVQVKVTWRTLQTIADSIMVHAQVSEKYINFALMYKTGHIFPVLPIKHLLNQYSEPTTPHSLSNIRVLLFPFVLQKATEHVYTKVLSMCHNSQQGFGGISFVIPQHQKGTLYTYLVHGKYSLRMTFYLRKLFLVHYHTLLVYIKSHLPCDQQYCTFCTLHHIMTNWQHCNFFTV